MNQNLKSLLLRFYAKVSLEAFCVSAVVTFAGCYFSRSILFMLVMSVFSVIYIFSSATHYFIVGLSELGDNKEIQKENRRQLVTVMFAATSILVGAMAGAQLFELFLA